MFRLFQLVFYVPMLRDEFSERKIHHFGLLSTRPQLWTEWLHFWIRSFFFLADTISVICNFSPEKITKVQNGIYSRTLAMSPENSGSQ